MRRRRRGGKEGFTLVELMIVAIIVAILAAVAIPLMSGSKKRAMVTEAEAALGTVRSALRAMYAETGAYNTNANGIEILDGVPVLSNVPGISWGDLDGRYFDQYAYRIEDIGRTNYILRATGSNDLAGVIIDLNQDGRFTRTIP